MELIS